MELSNSDDEGSEEEEEEEQSVRKSEFPGEENVVYIGHNQAAFMGWARAISNPENNLVFDVLWLWMIVMAVVPIAVTVFMKNYGMRHWFGVTSEKWILNGAVIAGVLAVQSVGIAYIIYSWSGDDYYPEHTPHQGQVVNVDECAQSRRGVNGVMHSDDESEEIDVDGTLTDSSEEENVLFVENSANDKAMNQSHSHPNNKDSVDSLLQKKNN